MSFKLNDLKYIKTTTMKQSLLLFLVFFSIQLAAQKENYNLKKGYVAEGYDVTEYFNNTAVEGKKEFTVTYDSVKFKFANKKNMESFNANPKKFIPEYGGYCAYAIADNGKKVSINPKTFEIIGGKLYLFYNAWGTNTLELWNTENPKELKNKADLNWKNVSN